MEDNYCAMLLQNLFGLFDSSSHFGFVKLDSTKYLAEKSRNC